MYDTVKLFLKQDTIGSTQYDCLPHLTNMKISEDTVTGKTYVTGNAGNLRIGISEHGMSIIGSLPKFYTGHNVQALSREECKLAFEMMADTLCQPVQRAIVSRVDIGITIPTDYKAALYLPHLGHSMHYDRLTQPTSIRYQIKQKTKKFYDKVVELKQKRTAIPTMYKGKNLLRYELSYMQRLPKQLNEPCITPSTLMNEQFYRSMYDRWYKEYELIDKIGLTKMDTSKINTQSQYLKQLLAVLVQEKGLEAILHHIDTTKEQKMFKHASYYSNLKKKLRKMCSDSGPAEPSELIRELNEKVARTKQLYL